MGNLIGDFINDNYRINTPFYIHYGIHCPKQSVEEGRHWRRSQLIEKQGQSAALCRMITSLKDEINECDHIRHSLKEGAKFVTTELSTGFWSTPQNVENIEQVIRSIYRANEFRLAENTFIHLPQFLSILPMT